jgi:hypothetical protein
MLIGDDYIGWKGVTMAAQRFASESKLELVGGKGKFVLSKGPMPDVFPELFRMRTEQKRWREEQLKSNQ